MINRRTGFTLVELIVTMAMLGIALAVTSSMFIGLLNQYKQQGKITETNTEGIIGLELLRQDIERAGYGLPWVMAGISYNEAANPPESAYNDSPNNPPRQILSDNNYASGFGIATTNAYSHSDLLVIKAANVTGDPAGQRWSYVTTTITKNWGYTPDDLQNTDYVIALSPGSTDSDVRTLVLSSSKAWSYQFSAVSNFQPGAEDPQPRIIYGICSNTTNASSTCTTKPPRMPFNRADYYIVGPAGPADTTVPARCAPNTGVLVKAVIDQSDGARSDPPLPLLDCVADMKVLFLLDMNSDGNWDLSTDSLAAKTAQDIRTQLKEVRVYILAHEGQKDNNYTHNQTIIRVGDANPVIDNNLGHLFKIGTNINYRWKLYTIVVRPKNL